MVAARDGSAEGFHAGAFQIQVVGQDRGRFAFGVGGDRTIDRLPWWAGCDVLAGSRANHGCTAVP